MKKLALTILSVFSINSFACENISIYRLIANPKLFDGKCIETVGVIKVDFESWKLFTDRDSYEYYVIENSIDHNFYPDYQSEKNTDEVIAGFTQAYEGKLVRYKGVFKAGKANGKLASPTGSFTAHEAITILLKYGVPTMKEK
ncbi:hypothetical protein [Pseudoalteromonas sp. MMG012]|uniref:hypothetical protein n=1 Tax=Pseudoalteromonas sp. MMG012 TaxID=2822686 RepID=UPI001B3A26F0|nr:hypothetical protein [Pseudoalteromonas sp. MMG012]MBQ4851123.1 hypothetical protein [Pseudoalteromonas sp. MMG012]